MSRPMKHSGVDWLGDIPADWNCVHLKKIARIITGNTPSKSESDKYYSQESGYLWIKAEDLGSINPITNTAEYLTEDGIKQGRLFPTNTVYVCCIASVGKVGFCNVPASCNQQINGLIFYGAYWKYGFYTTIAQESEYINNASGNVMKIINSDKQSRLICPLPPLDEQQRIANFLDDECRRIDSVISKTRATVDEYKKLKQAIITRAVTRGIRANRPLKHSGVDWLGDIPADWELSKIKYVADFQPSCDTSKLTDESEITYTPMECIKNGYFINNTALYGSVAASLTPYNDGDIVVAKVTPCFENGNIAVMENLASGFGLGSSELFVLRPHSVATRYLFYWLQNDSFKQRCCATMTGTGGLKRVSPYFVRNSFVTFPPLDEQKEIAAYLDEKTAAIDSLVAKKNRLVSELESLKKSLIFEYVTGN